MEPTVVRHYRWACPDGGPAKTTDLADWARATLAATDENIVVSRRDYPTLSAIFPGRVTLAHPGVGVVQPGTVWLED